MNKSFYLLNAPSNEQGPLKVIPALKNTFSHNVVNL